MKSKGQIVFTIFYLLALFGFIYGLQSLFNNQATQWVSYNDFRKEVRAGHIADVDMGVTKYVGKFKPGIKDAKAPPTISTGRLPGIDDRSLLDDMEKQNVQIYGHIQSESWWVALMPWLLPILLIALIYGYGVRRMTGMRGPLTFGRSGAKVQVESPPDRVTFADVANVHEAKAELQEIV